MSIKGFPETMLMIIFQFSYFFFSQFPKKLCMATWIPIPGNGLMVFSPISLESKSILHITVFGHVYALSIDVNKMEIFFLPIIRLTWGKPFC